MRYIGNKTRLLPFLLDRIARLGLAPGRAHDAFAGTAAVGRALKGAGWSVASSDLMTYSYVLQRALVVARRAPAFADLRSGDTGLRRALRSERFRSAVRARGGGALAEVAEYLERWLEPEAGFITSHFSPAGGRMYFTAANAMRIDAVRCALHGWREAGLVGEDAYHVLLAALLEGADRVANTAGVYAAYIKSWQPNAERALALAPLLPEPGPPGSAHLADAAVAARALGPVELLYVDPPYNARQYGGYYHVPEIIARGWFSERPALAGKTGLLGNGVPRSSWCSAPGARTALAELVEATGARHVLVSYSTEGILAAEEIEAVLSDRSVNGRVRRFTYDYRRYRADRDRDGRRYRGDRVRELLFHARLRG